MFVSLERNTATGNTSVVRLCEIEPAPARVCFSAETQTKTSSTRSARAARTSRAAGRASGCSTTRSGPTSSSRRCHRCETSARPRVSSLNESPIRTLRNEDILTNNARTVPSCQSALLSSNHSFVCFFFLGIVNIALTLTPVHLFLFAVDRSGRCVPVHQ